MYTTLTPDKIKLYIGKLSQSNLGPDQILFKIQSVEKFVDWATGKGYLSDSQVNQIQNEIANFKATRLSLDSSEGLKSSPGGHKSYWDIKEFIKAKQYTQIPFFPYSVILVLLLLVLSIGLMFGPEKQKTATIFAAPSSSNILAFKGKITDKLGNPIDSKTDVIFSIYTSPTSASPLYTGACTGMNAVTPDTKGTIDIKIGKDCRMKSLPSSLFMGNQSLYLGIKAGSDPEMQPRKQLANVDFSLDSNKLQGFTTGQSPSTIPFINNDGDLLIQAEQASITAVSKSTNFSINSANILNLRAQNDVNIASLVDGGIHLQTGQEKLQDRVFISNNGNIGLNGADPGNFNVQVAGDIGPNLSNIYNLGSFADQWGAIYGQKIYQDGNEVCDISGNCTTSSQWSNLTSPTKSISLSMDSYKTSFTYGNATSDNSLFNLTDTAYNIGTGYLMNLSTAAGSQLNPLHISAAGTESLTVAKNGFVGIGTSSPDARLRVKESGPKNYTSYGGYLENASQNYSTDGIDKYGVYISSTGGFSGGVGTDTKNYGIYIATTSGADTNYDIYAASGASLTTGGVWTNASSRDLKENFSAVNPEEILNKIVQLDLTTWNYKSESNSIKHLGPVAEEFYSLFHLGNSDKSISTIDPSGVALVGIQALNAKVKQLELDTALVSVNNSGDIEIIGPSSNYTYDGLDQNDPSGAYSLEVDGKAINTIKSVGKLIAGSMKAGYIEVQDIVIKNTAFVNYLSAKKITSPLIEGGTIVATREADLHSIKTDEIAPLNSDAVNVNLSDKGELAKVIIKGLDNKAVTTIDVQGNITTNGNITSSTASVSGSLTANSIQSENLQSTNISANTATFSGELVADTIRSKALDQINEKISSNESSLSSVNTQVNSVQQLLAEIKNSSPTPVSSKNITVDNFTVTDNAMLYKATISDSLFIGNLIEKSNSILSLNSDLNISSLGTVSFFENAVVIAKDGSITTNGTVTAGTLAIKNSNQQTVASITNDGTATFNKVALNSFNPASPASTVIAASDNLARNGQFSPAIETTQETAGVGLLPQGSNEVLIYNDTIKDSSLIYLTPTTSVPSSNLTVEEKVTCKNHAQPCRPYFKVAISQTALSQVNFNWLIIN